MMSYINAFFGWAWRKKGFFTVMFASALLFFLWMFPFSDLSDAVTSAVARGSQNQVYVQFESLDVDFLPLVAASAEGVQADLMQLPTLAIKYLKVRPSWLYMLLSPMKLIKAARGDMEAQAYAGTLALAHVRADGILGGDLSLDLTPEKAEGGAVTARTELEIEEMDLGELQSWAELPVKMKGKMNAEIAARINTGMQEQPDGDFNVRLVKFSLPASTVMSQMGPINLPTLTLASANFRGRLNSGNLIIEEGAFGQATDPINGRVKGQLGIRLGPGGAQIGQYNFSVDMSTSKSVEKELAFAFLLLDKVKQPTATGSRYLFRIQGSGPEQFPNITQLSTF